MTVLRSARSWFVIVVAAVCVAVLLSHKFRHGDTPVDRNDADNRTPALQSTDKNSFGPGSSESESASAIVGISQTPASTAQEQSAATLGDAVTLDILLPAVTSCADVERMLAVYERDTLVRAQDRVMRTWPRYSEVREQLRDQFLSEIKADSWSTERLFEMALQLRDQFWESGGCLSPSAYMSVYRARLLLEQAHSREPENMLITDELVETIQTPWIRINVDPVSGEIVDNVADNEVTGDMLALRKEQFDQIAREMNGQYTLRWEDFVRVNDLAWLLHGTGKFEEAQTSVAWLIDNARPGGSTAYLPPLQRWRDRLTEKAPRFNYTMYMELSPSRSRFLYNGRLPSFKGHDPQERGLIPLHMR